MAMRRAKACRRKGGVGEPAANDRTGLLALPGTRGGGMKRRNIVALLCLLTLCIAGIIAFVFAQRQNFREWILSSDMYDAIRAGNASKVETLLQRGANPNRDGAGGLAGGTPLTWAIEESDITIMKVSEGLEKVMVRAS